MARQIDRGDWESAKLTPTSFTVNKRTTVPFPSRLSSLLLAVLCDQPCGRSQDAVLAAFFGDGPPNERGRETLCFEILNGFISTSMQLKAEKRDRDSYLS